MRKTSPLFSVSSNHPQGLNLDLSEYFCSKKIDPTDAVHNREAREIVFAAQFHTCAVTDYTLSFTRSELDYACDGKG